MFDLNNEEHVSAIAALKFRVDDSQDCSLLLYCESCAVDRKGALAAIRMNLSDFARMDCWCSSGFLKFGRIQSQLCTDERTHWVELSEAAWAVAHALRRQRADRMWKKRDWRKTEEAS